jgi:hypothetical protein
MNWIDREAIDAGWAPERNASAYQVLDGEGNPLTGVIVSKRSQEDIDRSNEKILELLNQLTDEERLDIFSEYCRTCGSKDPRCQCWNDE